jgi:hypothetical protein
LAGSASAPYLDRVAGNHELPFCCVSAKPAQYRIIEKFFDRGAIGAYRQYNEVVFAKGALAGDI